MFKTLVVRIGVNLVVVRGLSLTYTYLLAVREDIRVIYDLESNSTEDYIYYWQLWGVFG